MDCFCFSLQLQTDVHRAGLCVLLEVGVFRFERVEVVELIQPENAQFPQAVIENLALVEEQLAANHFIARGGIAGKFDAAHIVLFLLIELQEPH